MITQFSPQDYFDILLLKSIMNEICTNEDKKQNCRKEVKIKSSTLTKISKYTRIE